MRNVCSTKKALVFGAVFSALASPFVPEEMSAAGSGPIARALELQRGQKASKSIKKAAKDSARLVGMAVIPGQAAKVLGEEVGKSLVKNTDINKRIRNVMDGHAMRAAKEAGSVILDFSLPGVRETVKTGHDVVMKISEVKDAFEAMARGMETLDGDLTLEEVPSQFSENEVFSSPAVKWFFRHVLAFAEKNLDKTEMEKELEEMGIGKTTKLKALFSLLLGTGERPQSFLQLGRKSENREGNLLADVKNAFGESPWYTPHLGLFKRAFGGFKKGSQLKAIALFVPRLFGALALTAATIAAFIAFAIIVVILGVIGIIVGTVLAILTMPFQAKWRMTGGKPF